MSFHFHRLNRDKKNITCYRVRAKKATFIAAFCTVFAVLTTDGRQQNPLPAAALTGESNVWFDDITRPIALKPKQILTLVRGTFATVKSKRTSLKLLQGLPFDGGPRAIFLSGFDGKRTARVCFGVAGNLPEALEQALKKAQAEKLPSRKLRWLKIDIVQNALAIGGFTVRDTPLPLPSLVGLAFGPRSGLAFLPEQLMGGGMTDSKRRLSSHYLNTKFAHEKRWQDLGRWTAVSSATAGQKVCFFETLSFLTDGELILPLFRGHRLHTNPHPQELLAGAVAAADFMVEHCTKDRLIDVRLPEWRSGVEDKISPADHAACVLALVRLFQETEEQAYLHCAERFGKHLLSYQQTWGNSRRTLSIVEKRPVREVLETGEMSDVALLRTNALTVVALIELSKVLSPKRAAPYQQAAPKLVRYLIKQIQPGGDMIKARLHPSGDVEPGVNVVATALAAEAFVMLYEQLGESILLEHAKRVMTKLKESFFEREPMEALPRDPWLLEAIDRYFTFSHDRDWALQVERIALAIAADQVRNTELLEKDLRHQLPLAQGVGMPDLFGSVVNFPSMTTAAARTRAMTVAIRLLRDTGRRDGAVNLLAEAKPGVLFQLQAQMMPETLMYMARPTAYKGLFRDHLRNFGFDLKIQATQALSLLELYQEFRRSEMDAFPSAARTEGALKATRRRLAHFPRVLTAAILPGPAAYSATGSPLPKASHHPPANLLPIQLRPVPKHP